MVCGQRSLGGLVVAVLAAAALIACSDEAKQGADTATDVSSNHGDVLSEVADAALDGHSDALDIPTTDTAADQTAPDDGAQDQTASDDGMQDQSDLTIEVTRTKLGNPSWTVEDVAIFGGPCYDGTAAPAVALIESILPNHRFYPNPAVFGPHLPHDPPYDHELSEGLASLGIPNGPIHEFAVVTPPNCIFFAMLFVPSSGAPTGSSPDFGDGALLNPAGFPIRIDGALYYETNETTLIDPNFDSDFPALSSLTPAVAGDGYSHVVVTFAENRQFAAMQPGFYTLQLQMTETTGAGWELTVPFVLTPGPCGTPEGVLHPTATTCPTGQTCGSRGECRAIGSVPVGGACTVDPDCVAGAACSGSFCRAFCSLLDASCAGSDETCIPLAVDGVGACFPPAPPPCELLDGSGCSAGNSCTINAGVACARTGSTPLGGTCSDPVLCVPGSTCYGGVCTQWCRQTECPTGQTCQDQGAIVAGVEYGLCR